MKADDESGAVDARCLSLLKELVHQLEVNSSRSVREEMRDALPRHVLARHFHTAHFEWTWPRSKEKYDDPTVKTSFDGTPARFEEGSDDTFCCSGTIPGSSVVAERDREQSPDDSRRRKRVRF